MKIEKFVFRKPNDGQEDVFLVRKRKKYGLIALPKGQRDLPVFLNADALQARGGRFLAQLQWDEIRENVCFDPADEPYPEAGPYDPQKITCNYYVLSGGRWGILDEAGVMIREPVYEEALIVNHHMDLGVIGSCLRKGFFSSYDAAYISGRVLVCSGQKWGMLQGGGNAVLPSIYDSISIVLHYIASLNVFRLSLNGLQGIVDARGKVLLPIAYPSLDGSLLDDDPDSTVFTIRGSAGTGRIRLGDGKCLLSPEWDRVEEGRLYLRPDDEPHGYFFVVWKDGHCGLSLNDKGLIISPIWDEIVPQRIKLHDPVLYLVRKGRHWGFCDKNGHLISDAVWDEAAMCSNGTVCVKKDGKWGVLGADGSILVEPSGETRETTMQNNSEIFLQLDPAKCKEAEDLLGDPDFFALTEDDYCLDDAGDFAPESLSDPEDAPS